MIAYITPPVVLAVDGSDLPALGKAVAGCDRGAVAKSVEEETKRHGAFLIDGFAEQQVIAQSRLDLAERRRKLHAAAAGKSGDTEQALTLAGEAIDDRQRAIDNARTLDRLKQDALGWFRQIYITQCQGRGA